MGHTRALWVVALWALAGCARTGAPQDPCDRDEDCGGYWICEPAREETGGGRCVDPYAPDAGLGGVNLQPGAGMTPRPGGDGDSIFPYVFIVDDSQELVADGTPGVDICYVRARCGLQTISPSWAKLWAGEGDICGFGLPIHESFLCSTDRSNPLSACADTDCRDFVSLGLEGVLLLIFDEDLQGCTVEVFERADEIHRAERATISVCADEEGRACLTLQESVYLGEVYDGDQPAEAAVPSLSRVRTR